MTFWSNNKQYCWNLYSRQLTLQQKQERICQCLGVANPWAEVRSLLRNWHAQSRSCQCSCFDLSVNLCITQSNDCWNPVFSSSGRMLPTVRQSGLWAARTSRSALYRSHISTSLTRLLSTLAVLEQRDGKLNGGSLCAVTAGKKLGGSVTGFIAGSDIKAVAEQAAKGNGMDKVMMVDNGAYDKVGSRIFVNSAKPVY